MKTRNLIIAVAMLGSWSAQAKVFNFKNSQTGQTMSVSCVFPSSVQCQTKIEEVKERLRNSTNPNSTTLSAARASDAAGIVRNDARELRDHVSNGVSQGVDSAASTGRSVADAAVNLGGKIGNSVSNGVDAVAGKTYRVKVPGIDHSMTFHCHGGLESDECMQDKEATIKAIREGSTERSLAQHKLAPARDTAASVADTSTELAISTGRTIRNGVGRLNHRSCERKLARHASDFDDSYRVSGSELVSYEVKMDYIRERLVEEDRFESCEEHYNNALLGYQLKWAAGGETSTERTHIFDGLGRLANGDMGYWKNEQRAAAPQTAQR